MAQTLPQAMKKGDVKAKRNGKGQPKYVLGKIPNSIIDSAHVTLWRKVAEIPSKQRAEYYASEQRPTRSGILRWWNGKTVNSEPVVQSHGIVTDLGDLAGKQFGRHLNANSIQLHGCAPGIRRLCNCCTHPPKKPRLNQAVPESQLDTVSSLTAEIKILNPHTSTE